jgi:hypothetical protein
LYTVPAATSSVVSTISICNLSATATTYRIALRRAGATLANSQYIAYDTAVPASDTVALSLGLTLANTDVVSVYAGTGNVTFSIFGSEIT